MTFEFLLTLRFASGLYLFRKPPQQKFVYTSYEPFSLVFPLPHRDMSILEETLPQANSAELHFWSKIARRFPSHATLPTKLWECGGFHFRRFLPIAVLVETDLRILIPNKSLLISHRISNSSVSRLPTQCKNTLGDRFLVMGFPPEGMLAFSQKSPGI